MGVIFGRSGTCDSRCGVDGARATPLDPCGSWAGGCHKTPLTTGADDVLVGTANSDTFEATNLTYQTGDLLLDQTSTDADVLNLTTTQNIAATPTVTGIESINVAVEKVGAFTFDATGITGANTITVNRGDLLDGAIDGAGAVQISAAKSATFTAGTKVTDMTVGFSATGNATAAAVVNAGTGAVTVTNVGKGGVTVNGAADKAVSVAEVAGAAGSKATINSSGTLTVTNSVDELTLQGAGAAATYTVTAIESKANSGSLTVAGDQNVTVKAAAAVLTGNVVNNTSTGTATIEATAGGDLDMTDFDNFNSVVLGDDFIGATIVANSDQLITTKTNQTGTVTINNVTGATTGTARFAVLDNAADAAVTAATLNFGAGAAFEAVYIDATADKFTATVGVDLNDADLVLTGTQDVNLGMVTDANSITSASTGKVTLVSSGNTANEQVIALGAGADTVTVNSGSDLFVVNLGAGDNTLTITDALEESQFVTGAGADKVTLTNAQGFISVVTGAGNDTITLGALANVTMDGTTINGGDGTDTLKATVTADISDAAVVSIEKVDVATGVTLTTGATQFNALGAFELMGAGTLKVDGSAETAAVTLDGSQVTIGFGVTATLDLEGGAGDDVITSSIAADVLTGNAGDDTFVFAQNSGNTSTIINEITDFLTGTDKLKLGVAGSGTNFAEVDADSGASDQLATAADALAIADGATGFGGSTHAGKNFLFLFDSNTGTDGWLAIDYDADGSADQLIQLSGLVATGDVVATDIIA